MCGGEWQRGGRLEVVSLQQRRGRGGGVVDEGEVKKFPDVLQRVLRGSGSVGSQSESLFPGQLVVVGTQEGFEAMSLYCYTFLLLQRNYRRLQKGIFVIFVVVLFFPLLLIFFFFILFFFFFFFFVFVIFTQNLQPANDVRTGGVV